MFCIQGFWESDEEICYIDVCRGHLAVICHVGHGTWNTEYSANLGFQYSYIIIVNCMNICRCLESYYSYLELRVAAVEVSWSHTEIKSNREIFDFDYFSLQSLMWTKACHYSISQMNTESIINHIESTVQFSRTVFKQWGLSLLFSKAAFWKTRCRFCSEELVSFNRLFVAFTSVVQ